MPKRLLILICFLFVAAGGESLVRLDMSSEETYRQTLHAMKAQMADEQQEKLDLALAMIRLSVLQEIDPRPLSARRGTSARTAMFEALRRRLHGKTAQQVLELAPRNLAEFDQKRWEEMFAARSAGLVDMFLNAMIAEKRASIEATNDPVLKEKRLSELQSLLKWRDDLMNRRSRSGQPRFSSGSYAPPGGPYSTRSVSINIGNPGYLIPRNFISRIAWRESQDNHEHVVLQALWPGMEPRTKENERQWRYYDDVGVRVADWNAEREIRIVLTPPGRRASDGYNGFKNAIRLGLVDQAPGKEKYGLTPYPRKGGVFPTSYHVAESTAYLSPQNTPMVLKCKQATQGIMGLFPVNMSCEVAYVLTDGSGLHYEFYASSLEGWKERDIAVRKLVESFRRLH
jgi:hypothetical protein